MLSLTGCMSPTPGVVNVTPSYSYLSAVPAPTASDSLVLAGTFDAPGAAIRSAPQPWPVLVDQQAYVDGVAETLGTDAAVLFSQ